MLTASGRPSHRGRRVSLAAPFVEYECMSRQPSQISDRLSAEWLAGYRAALADFDRVIATIGGSSVEGLTPHVRARLNARLIEREAGHIAA